MDIQVIYDTICPWCFIGKRRLEKALALRPDISVSYQWRPFLLNREMPPEGIDRTAYLIRKFGSEARVRRIYGTIAETGQSVDIDFAFDRIHRTPNSVDSHRLVMLAVREGLADAVVERLFVEYFLFGRDIGARDVLLEIAESVGLDREGIDAYLDGNTNTEAVYDENTRAHRMGVNGVPAFVFNGRMVIAGAQEPQVLARMLDAALVTGDAA
ncbi:MAG: DsbA family oxidoreductase [Rhodospirillaceae bacterium]|jgi:predicted DsbA family dithiol-disulfide isomerase|nr:DsbA family oxidoreductase [Rhodospirillaceae bacterium]